VMDKIFQMKITHTVFGRLAIECVLVFISTIALT